MNPESSKPLAATTAAWEVVASIAFEKEAGAKES